MEDWFSPEGDPSCRIEVLAAEELGIDSCMVIEIKDGESSVLPEQMEPRDLYHAVLR